MNINHHSKTLENITKITNEINQTPEINEVKPSDLIEKIRQIINILGEDLINYCKSEKFAFSKNWANATFVELCDKTIIAYQKLGKFDGIEMYHSVQQIKIAVNSRYNNYLEQIEKQNTFIREINENHIFIDSSYLNNTNYKDGVSPDTRLLAFLFNKGPKLHYFAMKARKLKGKESNTHIIKAVKLCPNLTKVNLSHCNIDNSQILEFKHLENTITALNLEANYLTNQGVLNIADLFPHLKKLNLNRNWNVEGTPLKTPFKAIKIDNIGITALAEKLKEIESLKIKSSKIDDIGIEYLCGQCPFLRVLDLSNTLITDRSLQILQNCKKLQKLYLIESLCSPIAVKDFQKKHSQVKVEYKQKIELVVFKKV